MPIARQKLCQVSYETYVLALTVSPNQILSWSMPSGLMTFVKEAKSTIGVLVEETGQSFEELLAAFKSKELFTIFKAVGFSLKRLLNSIRSVTALIPKGLLKAFEELQDTALMQALKSGALKIDTFLDKHPVLRKLVGPALAGFLLWMWLNSAFIGDPDFDLDLSSVAAAFAGRFSIEELFSSPEGLASLAVFAAGFSGLGITWLGSNAGDLLLALIFTGAKMANLSKLASSLRKHINIVRVKANTMKVVSTSQSPIVANGLDAVRATKLLAMLGIKGAELQESTSSVLVFGIHGFDSAYHPLAKFYGAAKNESNPGWGTKRLVWSVPEVKGQVMLMQVANMTPLIIFRQM